MTATRDFRAEYLAARFARHNAANLAEQSAAEDRAMSILDEADAADVDLYPIALDLDAEAISLVAVAKSL